MNAGGQGELMNDHENTGALPFHEFCKKWGIGRTKGYEEIKCGRLTAHKVGRKTIITNVEGARWARALPRLETHHV